MSQPEKPDSYSSIRALLNRVSTAAKREAQTPQEYRAIDEQERDALAACWMK
jgi:hypothetical protein